MSVRRAAIGFVVRLAAAVAISYVVWRLFVTPIERLPVSLQAVEAIVRVANFPVAVAGELLYPWRGMQTLFDSHDTWCEWCPYEEFRWQQLRLAIPTYVLLFYLPNAIRLFRSRRVAIALALYALPVGAWNLATNGDVVTFRIGGRILLILAAGGAIVWSRLSRLSKIYGLVVAWLAGSWWLSDLLFFIDRRPMPPRWPYLGLCVASVLAIDGGILWLTHALDSRSFSGTSSPCRTSP